MNKPVTLNQAGLELVKNVDVILSIAEKQSMHVYKFGQSPGMVNWSEVMRHYDTMAELIKKMADYISHHRADGWQDDEVKRLRDALDHALFFMSRDQKAQMEDPTYEEAVRLTYGQPLPPTQAPGV